ncbi:unnamed protein product [Mytilus edulis]|uniref:Reverse transcriptase domain-containing protein n=1 Tax=Mytilus edulis TaxID=6550 RepID=A0A8S3QDA1_MYTED|nr:unnamed protein product [Mytilus edulis]
MSNRKNRSFKARDKKRKIAKNKEKRKIYNINRQHKRRQYKHTEKVQRAAKYVDIFTKEKLCNAEILVLAKGLKFIPSPNLRHAKKTLINDFNELARKMRCKYHFDNGSHQYNRHPFLSKSGYKPYWANNAIENYLFSTRIELEKIQIKSFKDNLPKHERKALQSLRSNDRIIIKKADKNSSTVVLDKELYIKMANDQLNDNVHYERIYESHTTEVLDSINTIIHRLHNESYIDEVTFKFLINDQGKRLGRLYFLPKLHKINQSDREKIKTDINHLQNVNVPGRPIVSLCNSPLEKIAQYIDYFIKPVVNKFWTYTQDTTSFINKLEKIRAPADILMSSFDISSMYTNLHHTEIINAIDRAWPLIMQCKFDIPVPPKKALLELLRISLANNEFEFNGQIFKQKVGVPMGSPMSPSLTDIRIYEIVSAILKRFPYSSDISLLSVYRDDGFLLFKGSEQNKQNCPPLVLATKFNPLLKQLGRRIRKHWQLIENDITAKNLFPRPPMIAYRKHKNVKEYLTSAKL